MDTISNGNDEIDYVSDSYSESSQSDYDLDLQSDNESSSDIDFGNTNTTDVDFSVPDIKANPPNWTDKIESITVPPPKNKGGLTLPAGLVTFQVQLIISSFFLKIHLSPKLFNILTNMHRLKLLKNTTLSRIMLTSSGLWMVRMMYFLKKCVHTSGLVLYYLSIQQDN